MDSVSLQLLGHRQRDLQWISPRAHFANLDSDFGSRNSVGVVLAVTRPWLMAASCGLPQMWTQPLGLSLGLSQPPYTVATQLQGWEDPQSQVLAGSGDPCFTWDLPFRM